ncbi:MAG: hypothetical protein R3B06_02390 [Kofleriaceae bacterium]
MTARRAAPALVALAALLFPAAVTAQPALTPPSRAVAPAVSTEMPVPTRYNPDTALGLSLGVTLAGVAVSAVAGQTDSGPLSSAGGAMIFFGPSVGHWYTGDYLTTGLGMRVAGSGLAVLGIVMALSGNGPGRSSDGADGTGLLLVMAGAGLYVGGTVHDIATAPRAARRKNRTLAARVALSPTVTRTSAGLAVGGSF